LQTTIFYTACRSNYCSYFQRQLLAHLIGAHGKRWERLMVDQILRIAALIMTAVLGILVWSIFPEAQTAIACLLAASAIFYVFFAAVKATVGRLIGDQLTDLNLQINAVAERLELVDRKTTAVLKHSLEQREAANASHAQAQRRPYAVQHRSV
jgi:hypothetical protein